MRRPNEHTQCDNSSIFSVCAVLKHSYGRINSRFLMIKHYLLSCRVCRLLCGTLRRVALIYIAFP